MAEYIERETALNKAREILRGEECDCEFIPVIFEVLQGLPTADVAPVVRGRWIPEQHKDQVSQTEYHSYTLYRCSECGRRLIGYRDPREAPFCHCGAKME